MHDEFAVAQAGEGAAEGGDHHGEVTAGPEFCAAARPVKENRPAPMIAPIPRATSCTGASVRLSWCAPALRFGQNPADGFGGEQAHNRTSLQGGEISHADENIFCRASGGRYNDRYVSGARGRLRGDGNTTEDLATVRQRILGFALRRLVPHRADFAQAEDIAQSCVVVLWEQYPEKRELAEMVRIAIGTARHKIAQFQRDREKMPDVSDAAADRLESRMADTIPIAAIGCSNGSRRAKRRTGCCSRWSDSRHGAANCCGSS